tara:strand:+ start:204 stop:800 length:597 start_codon:yes stop_codon:yes gene_type:complete
MFLILIALNTLFYVHSLSISNKNKAIIVTQNTPLVHYFANRNCNQVYNGYNCPKIEKDELVQEGMYGLLRAIDKYDPKKGTKFSTYASYWIQAYMIKYKNKKNHIHIPYNQRKNNVNIDTYLSDDLYYVENKYNENLNVFADLFTGLELNNYERLLLKKRFVDDMSYNKIGKDIGLSSTKIAYDCNNLYKKIKDLTDE